MTGAKVKPLQKVKRKTGWKEFKDNAELSALLLPGVILMIVFMYIPMFGVIIAFKDYRNNLGIFGSEWVGFQNFQFFFTSQDAWRIARNTMGYGIMFIVVNLIAAVIVAILLYEVKSRVALKFYQTSMILPHFLSWVIVGYITYILLEPNMGVFNQIIRWFGGEGLNWYSEPKYWIAILPLVNLWKNIGLKCIMYYAALMGIDRELFEAAEIDGANRFKQILHITLPSLVPLMTILTILDVGHIIKGDFGLFYTIPRDVGSALSDNRYHRHVCVPRAENGRRYWHHNGGWAVPVGHWFYHGCRYESDCEEDFSRQFAVLRRESN